MSYGYFQFGPETEQSGRPFPLHCKDALPITKCLKTSENDFWIFSLNAECSVSATLVEGGVFLILKGKETLRGMFTAVHRQWDPEFKNCLVCWSNSPSLRWVIGINAYDIEGEVEKRPDFGHGTDSPRP